MEAGREAAQGRKTLQPEDEQRVRRVPRVGNRASSLYRPTHVRVDERAARRQMLLPRLLKVRALQSNICSSCDMLELCVFTPMLVVGARDLARPLQP